jgi:hypothetical protein
MLLRRSACMGCLYGLLMLRRKRPAAAVALPLLLLVCCPLGRSACSYTLQRNTAGVRQHVSDSSETEDSNMHKHDKTDFRPAQSTDPHSSIPAASLQAGAVAALKQHLVAIHPPEGADVTQLH